MSRIMKIKYPIIRKFKGKPYLRLKNIRGPVGENWYGKALEDSLMIRGESGRLSRGKRCGRNGVSAPLNIYPGEVQTQVCCTGSTFFRVLIRFQTFSSDDWTYLIDQVSMDSALSGALLTREFQILLVEELKNLGLNLIPGPDEFRIYCQCNDFKDPCMHGATAFYHLIEAVDVDPFLLFMLRGMRSEDLVQAIQTRRNGKNADKTFTSQEAMSYQSDNKVNKVKVPDTCSPVEYFKNLSALPDLSVMEISDESIPAVKLFGPSGYLLGGRELADRISELYQIMREYADNI